MLEISIFCVILFAIAYWATLFIMGRREDVLHGEFVEAEPELADAALPASAAMPIFCHADLSAQTGYQAGDCAKACARSGNRTAARAASGGRNRAGKTGQRGSAAIAAGITQARAEERRADLER